MNKDFWKGKKVLITGHTGFKGSWLSIWLHELGAEVTGYSLLPDSQEGIYTKSKLSQKINSITADIRDREQLCNVFKETNPEIVFHLAAQPLVIESYNNPYYTYEVNVMGTMNVLEAVRSTSSVKAAVFITTDKCYENKETLEGYKETDPFGGYDPYSSSKACDEILIASYRNSFFSPDKYNEHKKAIASVRAGNVIGGGDFAANRIIPDVVRAIEAGQPICIRNRYAIRPWQHVLEPLSGYITLAEKLFTNNVEYSEGWNFGPQSDSIWTVADVASYAVKVYGKGNIKYTDNAEAVHEAGKLVLNIDKAKSRLNWIPKLNVEQAVEWTIDWYMKRNTEDCYDMSCRQINQYMNMK